MVTCPKCGRQVSSLLCGHCHTRLPPQQSADLAAVYRLLNAPNGGTPTDCAQKSGNPVALVPTVVQGDSSDLLAAVAQLYFRPGMRIADVTYGLGVFWRQIDLRQYHLDRSDLYVEGARIANYDCRNLPYEDGKYDVITLDLPFVPKPLYQANYRATQTHARAAELITLYEDGMAEAYRVLRPGGLMIVKCQDTIEGGKQIRVSILVWQIARDLNMIDQDRFVLVPTRSFAPAAKQYHARKAESYLWVFRRPKPRLRHE